MKRNLTIGFVLCILLLMKVDIAKGQHWTQIPLPSTYYEVTPYFLNENIGFVFDASKLGTLRKPNLLRTIDGGATWINLPFFNNLFDNQNIELLQLYFTDINRGYAAASDGVYETEDTGNSWRSIYRSKGQINSIYAFGGKVFAFEGEKQSQGVVSWGPLVVTNDNGNTWDTLIRHTEYFTTSGVEPMTPYVIGNKDGFIFAENILNTNTMQFVFSTNNGKDWHSNTMDIQNMTYTMGLFSFPHCSDLLRTFFTPNDVFHNDVYYIVHSSDFGAHWDTLGKPLEIGAWIAGNNCVQYISDALGTQNGAFRNGVLRSQDHGSNWILDNGPILAEIDDGNWDFHNFSVMGGGAVVYVGDFDDFDSLHHHFWKTTDGGDGTLSLAALASHISLDHTLNQGTSVCDTSDLNIFFQNLSCNYSLLKNFTIEGLDSTQYSSQWLHHLACDDIADSLLIKIFPFYPDSGTFTFHGQFMNDEYQIIDTSFTFTIKPLPGQLAGIYIKSAPFSGGAGDTLETPIYINSTPSPAQPGATTVTLTYTLNTNLLTPFAFIPINGVTADPVQITKTTATVTLHFDPSFTFSGETELGRLRCVAYVTDTLETDIILTGAAHSSGCLATLADSNVTHFTLTGCGAPTLSKFLKYGAAYEITSIVPNPAGNSVQVQLKNNGALLHYQLLDALGAMQKSGTTTGSQLQINLSGLSSGNYYFRLSGEGGIPVTKSLVIVK